MTDLQGGDWGVSQPFGGVLSGEVASPYAEPSLPEIDPFRTITAPPHVSSEIWQESYYDPRSQAPVSGFAKRPSGPVSLETGKIIGDFHQGHRWQQV